MNFTTGKGTKRPGMRLLTVGTDCSVGKKYTALAIDREMHRQGMSSDFRATGQTGVLISGRGLALDAVVADFISGAAEWICPDNEPDHWDIVEGQGSLFHPSFAGVTLGLLHGAQPDAFVVCHEPTRTTMRGVKHPLPTHSTGHRPHHHRGPAHQSGASPASASPSTPSTCRMKWPASTSRKPAKPTACPVSIRFAPVSNRSWLS